MVGAVILSRIHLVEYVFLIEDVNPEVFNMIKGMNESRTLAKHSCAIVEINLMVGNVT